MTLLCLLLAAAPVDAGVPPKVLRFDVPHVIEQSAVPERLFASEYPVTVHAVKSTETPENLVHFFLGEFEKAHLFRMPPDQLPEPMRSQSITGLDPNTMISYTIIFQPNPDHTTTAIIGETYLTERRHTAAGASQEVAAVFPGATQLVQSTSEALKTLNYRAPADAAEVMKFYGDVLPKGGFKQVEPETWERPGTRLKVVARDDEKGSSRVTVLVTPR